jgi:protein Tex
VIPLTDEMKKGKEPLRTFGDLLQFYELKQQPGDPPKSGQPPVEPQTAVPEQTAPAVNETPATLIAPQPTDGEISTHIEMPPEPQTSEPQATEQQTPPADKGQPEPPVVSENDYTSHGQ